MSSTVQVQCPECAARLKIKTDGLTGKQGRCPKCSHLFRLDLAAKRAAAKGTTAKQTAPQARPRTAEPSPRAAKAGRVVRSRPVSSPTRKTAVSASDDFDYDIDDEVGKPKPKSKSKKRPSKTWKTALIVGGSVLAGLLFAGGGLWYAFQDGLAVPDTIADNATPNTTGMDGAESQPQAPSAPEVATPQAVAKAEVATPATTPATQQPVLPDPQKWQQMRSDDGVFSCDIPAVRFSSRQMTNAVRFESLTNTDNAGIRYMLSETNYPKYMRTPLKDQESFLKMEADKFFASYSGELVSHQMIPDHGCACLESQFRTDQAAASGDDADGRIVLMRTFVTDRAMYRIVLDIAESLDKAVAAERMAHVFASIAVTPPKLHTATAEERLAVERMKKIHAGLAALRRQQTSPDAILKAFNSPTPLNSGVPADKQLSWRVKILPFVGHEELFEKFKLDEPWDSPHNQTLIPEMPELFALPESELPLGQTIYHRPNGEGTVYRQELNRSYSTTFGSDRIELLEVNLDKAVAWTDPGDFDVSDPAASLRNLGKLRQDGFLVNGGIYVPLKLTADHFKKLCLTGQSATFPD